ncbi:MAG: TolC family protein [Tannerellaceae bacterium]
MKKSFFIFATWIISCGASAQTALTMDKALDIAMNNSPTMRKSAMNLDRYQQTLVAQKASLKSRFSLKLDPIDYSKNRSFDNRLSQWYTNETLNTSGTFQVDQPILFTDGVISLVNRFGWQDNKSDIDGSDNSNRAFRNNLYLQLSQPIFTYNRRKMELKEIELDYENAAISYALQRLDMERRITDQFYAVYMAQSNLSISIEELEDARKNFEVIKNKVEADLAARDELFQAELNLATAESNTEDRRVALENAKDLLKQTLGMQLNEAISIFAEIQVEPVKIDIDKAITHALSTRLELREREIEAEKLDFQMIKTKSLNEFKGDISLSFGLTGDNKNLGKVYDQPTQSPRVAVSFTVPIFDWGEKKARVKAQETAILINRLDKVEDEKKIELDIRKTYRNLENNLRQINIAEQNVKNAQLTYDLNAERYRNGDLTGMEMSQFQTQLSNKKMTLAQARINYKIELLNLKIQTLYDFDNNQSIVPLTNYSQPKKK